MTFKLDSFDRKILAIMQTNGRGTNLELAEQIGVDVSIIAPTLERAWRVGLAFAIICSMSACIPKNRAGEVLAPRGQLVFRAKTFK